MNRLQLQRAEAGDAATPFSYGVFGGRHPEDSGVICTICTYLFVGLQSFELTFSCLFDLLLRVTGPNRG